MVFGYARCSTNEAKQDIDRQVRELKSAGAEKIFLEYEHGDSAVKEQLSLLLEQAQAGDTILTLEVSRLARSTKQLCDIIETVKAKHLRLSIVGSIQVDCSNGELDPMPLLYPWNAPTLDKSWHGNEYVSMSMSPESLSPRRPLISTKLWFRVILA